MHGRAKELSHSSGCYIASRLPCRVDEEVFSGGKLRFVSSDFHTSGTSNKSNLESQKMLLSIEQYYNLLKIMNTKIGFEFVIGEMPSNLVKLEEIKKMIAIYAH